MIDRLMRAALRTLLALVLCGGCASSARPLPEVRRGAPKQATRAACMRPHLDQASPYHLPLAGPAQEPELQAYLANVPRELRRTLLATGLEPLFASLLREQARAKGLTLELLSMKQELSARLDTLASQLASVLFEIDCTGDALESLLLEFERNEHERELTLTISSLVVAAVTGVVAGAWDARGGESKGPPIVAASGAGTSAALGVAAFMPKRQSVRLVHERNLLAPVRTGGDEDRLYPTFVFRLMTLPEESGQPTPQRELLSGWDELTARSLPVEGRAARVEILYGKGGLYDQELLKLREGMFDQLESQVTAFYRDLELLERYVAKMTEPGSPG